MNINEEALKLHEENRGKIEVISKTEVKDMHDLAVVYTPGVAEPCRKIHHKTSGSIQVHFQREHGGSGDRRNSRLGPGGYWT